MEDTDLEQLNLLDTEILKPEADYSLEQSDTPELEALEQEVKNPSEQSETLVDKGLEQELEKELEELKSLERAELQQKFKESLIGRYNNKATIDAQLSKFIYIWTHKNKDKFWKVVTSNNFEEDARSVLTDLVLAESGSKNKDATVNEYIKSLKRFHEFIYENRNDSETTGTVKLNEGIISTTNENTPNDDIEIFVKRKPDYNLSEDDLAKILNDMCTSPASKNQNAAIIAFALKYYKEILKLNNNTKGSIKKNISKCVFNGKDSFASELNKGLALYELCYNCKFGFKLDDPYNEKANNTQEEDGNALDNNDSDSKAHNIIYYGVPGSGKSHQVNEDFPDDKYKKTRVVFHPDYTNADFVGQILPCLNASNQLEYKFNPGPFSKILSDSKKNPKTKYCLIIEEINRGNAPAIFGEVFQLLDRDEHGESRYGITNADIAKEVYGNEKAEIKIPNNLSIIATMNTSDQNVFTLDTAFQRRWDMKYVKNSFDNHHFADMPIGKTGITWRAFAETVNNVLADTVTGFGSNEDKGLGAYFISKKDLENADAFAEKVLKYLWDDAFKMERTKFFAKDLKQLHHVLEKFERPTTDDGKDINPLQAILKEEVYKEILDKVTAEKNSGNKQENNTTSSEAADDAGEQ